MTETPQPNPANPANPSSPAPQALTDDEAGTVRSAAILAGALVSKAESGFIDTFKESFAASKAIKGAPAEIQQLLAKGGMPNMPKVSSPAEMESATMDMLRQAVAILQAKAPNLVEGYRATVVQSCRDVAAAADDTSANEQGVIAKVEQALAG